MKPTQILILVNNCLAAAWAIFEKSMYYAATLELFRRGHVEENTFYEIYSLGYRQGMSDAMNMLCEPIEPEDVEVHRVH